ncbi:MAG: tetratricopeptide repeat protein [Cyanobacteria bacterium HKST-UBA01]|nr:tetratricopeptide repeat protein [Cyanobacteria bacterium HKST-UBA01]
MVEKYYRKLSTVSAILLLLVFCWACEKSPQTKRTSKMEPEKESRAEDKLFNGGVIGYSRTSYKDACRNWVAASGSNFSYEQILKGAEKANEFNDFESGKALTLELVSRKPQSSKAHFLLGKAMYNCIGGKETEALVEFKKCLSLTSEGDYQAEACEYLARIYYERSELDEALQWLEKSVNYDPEHVSVYRFRAVIYSDKKLYDKAEADFNKCIELNPRGMMSYYNRAKFYESIGKNKEALADYDKVIANGRSSGKVSKEEDRQAVVFKYKAKLLSKMGRLEEAIDSISAAIAISKLLPEDYTIRGELYLELKEYEKALADFNQALELSPTMAPEAYLGRASAYEHLGKKELADRDRKQAASIKAAPAEKPIYEIKRD